MRACDLLVKYFGDTAIRTGDSRAYEDVGGVRVECGDPEVLDSCRILCWRCPIEEAIEFARRELLDVDWTSARDSKIPMFRGFTEAPIVRWVEIH